MLFAFFVVMFASSQTDKARAKQVSEAVEKALEDGHSISVPPAVAKILGGTVDDKGQGNAQMKGPGGAQRAAKEKPPEIMELLPPLQRLNKELADEIKAGKLEVKDGTQRLGDQLAAVGFLSLRHGRHRRNHTARSVKKVAELIGTLPNPIQLEGHTDSIPIHNARFRSNWELSCARAIAVLETLCEDFQLAQKPLFGGRPRRYPSHRYQFHPRGPRQEPAG